MTKSRASWWFFVDGYSLMLLI